MKFNNYSYFLLIFTITAANFILTEDKVDLFIAIYLKGESFNTFKNDIKQIQTKISKDAKFKNYKFNHIIKPSKLHITLNNIKDIDVRDIHKYENCIKEVVSNTGPFDILDNIRLSSLGILGQWVGLQFNSECDCARLFNEMRTCFSNHGLKVGEFDNFQPHISLGRVYEDDIPLDIEYNFKSEKYHKPLVIDEISLRKTFKNSTAISHETDTFKLYSH